MHVTPYPNSLEVVVEMRKLRVTFFKLFSTIYRFLHVSTTNRFRSSETGLMLSAPSTLSRLRAMTGTLLNVELASVRPAEHPLALHLRRTEQSCSTSLLSTFIPMTVALHPVKLQGRTTSSRACATPLRVFVREYYRLQGLMHTLWLDLSSNLTSIFDISNQTSMFRAATS